MEAIILAGGFGKRLRSKVSDLPKPMAPINNIPFLEYIFRYLDSQGITRVILSTGYMHEAIETYFGNAFRNIEIVYSIEETPLGTGGAIKSAINKIRNDSAFVINGDTFYEVDLKKIYKVHLQKNSHITMALKPMVHFDRYGTVKVKGEKVINFEEKKFTEAGLINGGVYLIKSRWFESLDLPHVFSFEVDFLAKQVYSLNITAEISDAYFIDIGIPEDYEKANMELKNHL